MQTEKNTMTDELDITEERGFEILKKVMRYAKGGKNCSDVLKMLMCDFELSTKEVVLASFFWGKMQNDDLQDKVFMFTLNKVVSEILDSKK